MIKLTLYALTPHLVNELGHTAIFHETFFSVLTSLPSRPCHYLHYLSQKASFPCLPPNSLRWFRNGKKNFTLFWDYYLLFKQKDPNSRIFFQENFSLKELLFLTFLLLFVGKQNDSLWLVFRYDFAQLRFRGRVHHFCLKILGRRVKQFTDSEIIAKSLTNPTILPICHTPLPSSERKNNTLFRCWWPGEPRPSKGTKEILGLLQSKDSRAGHFLLSFSKALEIETPPLLAHRTLSPILTRKEYELELERSDLIFLPYDKKNYKSSTSGIFVEAIVADKFVIVKEGTWLSSELRRFGLEELIVNWQDPLFFTKIFELLNNEEIKEKRKKMHSAYLTFHNKETFGKILEQAFQIT